MTKDCQQLPIYLLAGGRDTNRNTYLPVVKRLFSLTGKKRPRIAYIGAANDDNPQFIHYMSAMLDAAGPCDFELAPLAGKKGSATKARQIVEKSDMIFIGGGDVELGIKWILNHDFLGCLQEKHQGGAPIFGASAGAIMLCKQWVRWSDPDDDTTAKLFNCLGLAPTICDTHCEDDGWEELKTLLRLLSDEDTKGYGIRSGAAIEVAQDGSINVIVGKVDAYTLKSGRVQRV